MGEKVVGQVEHMTIAITGLGCGGGGCLMVERAIAKVAGVRRVYVNPATEMAYVDYDPNIMDRAQLIAAVERTGLHAVDLRRR